MALDLYTEISYFPEILTKDNQTWEGEGSGMTPFQHQTQAIGKACVTDVTWTWAIYVKYIKKSCFPYVDS